MLMVPRENGLFVREWGQCGERAVLLHGSINIPLNVWTAQYELADQYHLLMPDRRGYGDSAPIDTKASHEIDVDDTVPLLGDGAHLVGFSSGGVIALLVADRRPDLVRSLTLLEPPAMQAARGNPLVEEYLARAAPLYACRPQITPEQFIHGFGRMHMAHDAPETPVEPVAPEYYKSVYATE
jgi:pimeloyl-ACP methyl ester carboxylesterase